MLHFRFKLHPKKPISVIYAINFLTAFGLGAISPFLAIYFKSMMPVQYVGLVFAASYVISIVANIFGGMIIEHLQEKKTLAWSLFGAALTLSLLGFVTHSATVVVLFSIYTFLLTIVWFNIDLYVKHFSDTMNLSGNEGKIGVIGNLAWMIAPFFAGALAERYQLSAVFAVSAAFTLVALILFLEVDPHEREFKSPKHDRFLKAAREYFHDSQLARAYVVAFGLAFLYSSWTFVPLLLEKYGSSITGVGLIYGLCALPWVLFEYPVGKLADAKYGERRFIISGFIVAAAATVLLSFADSIVGIVAVLFVAITGSSLIERTHVAYFFRRIDEDDVEKISVWRTATGLGYVFGPLLSVPLFAAGSIELYYFVIGCLTLCFAATAWGLSRR